MIAKFAGAGKPGPCWGTPFADASHNSFPGKSFTALQEWTVSLRVNRSGVDDDDPALIEPAA
jgi:hypothetical protein